MPRESDANGGHREAAAGDDVVARAVAERRALRRAVGREAQGSTFRRALAGWCESGVVVALATAGGRTHRVRIVGIGADVVVADIEGDRRLVLGVAAVRSVVEIGADRPQVGADGPGVGTGVVMADILARWLPDEPEISVWIGGRSTAGRLVAVGPDVVVLSTGGRGDLAYVRLDSTTEMSVSVSSSL